MVRRQYSKEEHLAFFRFELLAMADYADSNSDLWAEIYHTWVGDKGSPSRATFHALVGYLNLRIKKRCGNDYAFTVDFDRIRSDWLTRMRPMSLFDLRIELYKRVYEACKHFYPSSREFLPLRYRITEGASPREASNNNRRLRTNGIANLSSNGQTLTGHTYSNRTECTPPNSPSVMNGMTS